MSKQEIVDAGKQIVLLHQKYQDAYTEYLRSQSIYETALILDINRMSDTEYESYIETLEHSLDVWKQQQEIMYDCLDEIYITFRSIEDCWIYGQAVYYNDVEIFVSLIRYKNDMFFRVRQGNAKQKYEYFLYPTKGRLKYPMHEEPLCLGDGLQTKAQHQLF